eukprot:snap_masked-scaffold_6-processed-gene-4.43-mRNA-1 protein AED:1.00 eAED:1.00 QI:0/0/0/0/1/1/2/0/125
MKILWAMRLTEGNTELLTEETALRSLRAAFDSGVRHFDTAYLCRRPKFEGTTEYSEVLVEKLSRSLTVEKVKDFSVTFKSSPATDQMQLLTEFHVERFLRACNGSAEILNLVTVSTLNLCLWKFV